MIGTPLEPQGSDVVVAEERYHPHAGRVEFGARIFAYTVKSCAVTVRGSFPEVRTVAV